MLPNRNTSPMDTVRYFSNDNWGAVIEDDKYWEDEDLFENFIIFYVHAFAWLGLPRPTLNQLLMAVHVQCI